MAKLSSYFQKVSSSKGLLRKFGNIRFRLKHLSRIQLYFLIIISCLILGGLYIISALLLISPARIALAELKSEYELIGPCHESCRTKRQISEKLIVQSLEKNKRVKLEVIRYISDNTIDLEFKMELLNIIKIAYGGDNPPDYLIEILMQNNTPDEIKASIIDLFLLETRDDALVEYYFEILNSTAALEIKREAIRALSSYSKKTGLGPRLENLKLLALDYEMALSLRADILFLLNDCYLDFPEETSRILFSIYASSSDIVLKALSAEILNSFGNNEVVIPLVPEGDWEKII